jgi:hypothetical protein
VGDSDSRGKTTTRRAHATTARAAIIVTLAAGLFLHHRAGLTLPIPWPDESSFLWPAIGLAEHGSLFAPQLDPARPLLWMPPGYSVVAGAVFAAIGFSLVKARALSWVLAATAYVGLTRLARAGNGSGRGRWAPLAILSLLFLGRFFVVTGNVGRMEALLLAMAVWGFVLLELDRPWKGLALLVTLPLTHPNGVYFVLAAAAYLLVRRPRPARPSRGDIVCLAVAAALWAVCATYAFGRWPWFVHDMTFQFARKLDQGHHFLRRIASLQNVIIVAVLVGALVRELRSPRGARAATAFALGCLPLHLLGGEIWYETFLVLAYFLAGLSWVELAGERTRHPAGAAGAFGAVLVLGVAFDFVDVPGRLRWGCMTTYGPDEYLREDERSRLIGTVIAAAHGIPDARVEFRPEADGLLFWPAARGQFLPSHPIFAGTEPDVAVIHASRANPDCALPAAGAMERWGIAESDLVLARGEDERWYVKRLAR